MNNEDRWSIYFAGILALRFHPANDKNGAAGINADIQVATAAQLADIAMIEHQKRWPVETN